MLELMAHKVYFCVLSLDLTELRVTFIFQGRSIDQQSSVLILDTANLKCQLNQRHFYGTAFL